MENQIVPIGYRETSHGVFKSHCPPKYFDASSKHEKSIDIEVCSICLDNPKDAVTMISCLHSFCFICIEEWFKIKFSCPLCKSKNICFTKSSVDLIGQFEIWKPKKRNRQKLEKKDLYNAIKKNKKCLG